MSRALVLGGGGPVGVGWEAGLILGLAAGGVDLAAADLIVGTSAGSIVGAYVAAGQDLSNAAGQVQAATGTTSAAPVSSSGFDAVMVTVTQMASAGVAPQEIRRELGRVARESATVTEAEWLGVFADMAGWPWPERFACTGVDVESGDFVVWDRTAGASLQAAVASSCAVPGIFPPVSIDGRRYMDGGMRTALNADVAAGHDVVVAVSCMALALPAGMTDPLFEMLIGETRSEMETVAAAGGKVEVVEPGAEFLEVSGWGLNLMDFSRVEAAIAAGVNQASAEVGRLRAAWST